MARFTIIALATTLLPTATMAFSTTTPISSSSSSSTALFSKNAQDPTRTAPAWTQATSSTTTTTSAPSSSSSATATLEKDEVAEIPQQANSWTNVLDTPRGQKARDLPGWAKRS